MTPQDALDDLRGNCDHGVEPDCWYCEIAAVITDQQSKLHDSQFAESGANELVATLEAKLGAAVTERDEHRKALDRLSAFFHNPALEPTEDQSFSDALVEYAVAELKARASRLTSALLLIQAVHDLWDDGQDHDGYDFEHYHPDMWKQLMEPQK